MRRALVLAAALTLAPPFVQARAQQVQVDQPADAPYRYRVRPGDTMSKVAAAYFTDPAGDAAAVRRLNGVGASRLIAGTTLSIPMALLRTEALGARLTAFRGDVTIGGQAVARRGMVVGEGVRIATGANASASFQLSDGSTVTLPSLSVIRIVRLRRVLISGKVQRVLALDAGRSESQVTPRRGGSVSYEIRTPVSVAAVRGTVFRVTYSQEDRAATAGVLKGAVGVQGADGVVGLPAGYGARSDRASAGRAVALLPPPEIESPVAHRRDGTLLFTFRKMALARAYRLVIAADNGFQDLRGEATSVTGRAEVQALPSGTYYIRATVIDANGIEGRPTEYPYDHAIAPGRGG